MTKYIARIHIYAIYKTAKIMSRRSRLKLGHTPTRKRETSKKNLCLTLGILSAERCRNHVALISLEETLKNIRSIQTSPLVRAARAKNNLDPEFSEFFTSSRVSAVRMHINFIRPNTSKIAILFIYSCTLEGCVYVYI